MNLSLLACATCQTTFAEAGGEAMGWSIMFLLIVILMLVTGVVVCMVRIMRREEANLDPELRDVPLPIAGAEQA